MTFSDNMENWRTGKYIGIVVFSIYALYILTSGYLDEYLSEFWFYFLEPSVSLGLIIYSKPASELVEGLSSFFTFGEDLGFIIGWLGLGGAITLLLIGIA